MAKKNIGRSFNIYPMPVVIVGTVTDGKPNFMTAAWVTKLNSDPPLWASRWAANSTRPRASSRPASSASAFPASTRRCCRLLGLVHGYEEDKAAHVDIFEGALAHAPMVRQCPVTMECRLVQTVELPKDYFFIGEVANVYASEAVLTDGKVDVVKLRPFVLTMPEQHLLGSRRAGGRGVEHRQGLAEDHGGFELVMITPPAPGLPVALGDVPAAEWAAAIVVRHSARTFTGDAVDPAKLQQLELLCESLPAPEVARVVLVREVPDIVFTGFVGSYGRVLGAPSALLMIATESAPSFQESAGYLGEAVILEATSLGLGTCWIAGFFDRAVASTLVPLAPGERVLAISPVG